MPQRIVQLQDHLAVIINQCDILEDSFSARSEVMSRLDVIRNAVHRIVNAIADQTGMGPERLGNSPETCVPPVRDNTDLA